MSYARINTTGHYIWHDGEKQEVRFDTVRISDDLLDIFLYKVVLTRLPELKDRIINGRKLIFDFLNNKSDEEQIEYKDWLLQKESEKEIYNKIIN